MSRARAVPPCCVRANAQAHALHTQVCVSNGCPVFDVDDEFAPGYDYTWGVYDEDTGEWVLVGLRCKSEIPGITINMALEALEKKKLEEKSIALALELEEEKKVSESHEDKYEDLLNKYQVSVLGMSWCETCKTHTCTVEEEVEEAWIYSCSECHNVH